MLRLVLDLVVVRAVHVKAFGHDATP